MFESVPLPQGYQTAGVSCGIKGQGTGKLDLALFVSDTPASSAAVFTKNLVCGAPVKVSRERVPRGSTRAIVINSGNANTCTGERGLQDARRMTQLVADEIGCGGDDVLICSTGVIGRFLPMDVICKGIPTAYQQLGDSYESFVNAARAMMTTDTVHKQSTREFRFDGKSVRVSGAAKGAAMIAPNMGTMLGVVLTDANLTPQQADRILKASVQKSFNCISVEGHTSTSDTVILLANGAANAGPLSEPHLAELTAGITDVCAELARAIIRDAEGAGHVITLDVAGLRTEAEADRIARSIGNDVLVKTAIAGNDPNWGRIVSAAGRTGVDFRESDVVLTVNGVVLFRDGAPTDFDEKAVSASLGSSR